MNKLKLFSILLIVVVVYFLLTQFGNRLTDEKYPELTYLANNNLTFTDLQTFFKKTSESKGGAYSFNLLKVATLPPNTDIHLLAHTIGDVLYKQQGMNGIKICTQDFRNACSHSIVVGLLVERGSEAFSDIAEVCRKAPGGIGAYGMCFHGLGHGILAFLGYDMSQAVVLCQSIGTKEYGFVETSECVGGLMMEMVSGVHDKVAWEKQKDKYLKTDDPLYPCNQSFIPELAKGNCYNYLTPHLWEIAGADAGDLKAEDFKKSFEYCSKIPEANMLEREFCYGGFGKEFVGLAQSRDIRKTEKLGETDLKTISNWCLLANESNGIQACIRQAVNSLYWGGENKPDSVLGFCGILEDSSLQDMCYRHLVGSFKYYNPNKFNLLRECNSLPTQYIRECSNQK